MLKKYLIVILPGLLLLGCAVIEAPSGGPEDKKPPRLIGVTPAEDSAGVSRSTSIVLSFDENIDGESFKKKVAFYPPVEIKKMKAKGSELKIEFQYELPETTICFIVRGGFKDYHGVQNKRNFSFCFSTADSIDRGTISGRIFFKDRPDSTGIAELFEIKSDTTMDFTRETPSRVAFASFDGAFSFKALPTDSARYLILAFLDSNGDGRLSVGKEFSAALRDTFILTPSRREISGVDIVIIDPNEPGEVSGFVENQSGYEKAPSVLLEPKLPHEKSIYTKADTTGRYIFKKVKPGAYLLMAFIDLKPDSICGTFRNPEDSSMVVKEPCTVLKDSLVVKPGAKVEAPRLIIGEGELK